MSLRRRVRSLVDHGVWRVADHTMVALLTAHAFTTRRRMSHLFGTAGRGEIRVVDAPTFPAHAFFSPGRTFPCRIRHASATFHDDAWLLLRSASLKFADADHDSPLDLEMNTGCTSLFSNTAMFYDFGKLDTGGRIQRDGWYYRKYPLAWESVKQGVRRDVRSYALLHYYTQTVSRFVGLDGVERFVRFRLLPASRVPDHGFATEWDFARAINQHRLPGETRSPTFLRDEWEQRVAAQGADHVLQLQLHDAVDDEEVVDSLREWDARVCPWHDVAEVRIGSVLPYAESNRMRFSVGHQPPSLGLLPARSVHDPNSLNQLRSLASRAKSARLASYRVFGEPAEDE